MRGRASDESFFKAFKCSSKCFIKGLKKCVVALYSPLKHLDV